MGVDDVLANLGPNFQILFTLFNTKSGFQGQSVLNLKPAPDPTWHDLHFLGIRAFVLFF